MKRSEFAITEAWKLYTKGWISWHDYVDILTRYTEYENRTTWKECKKQWEAKNR